MTGLKVVKRPETVRDSARDVLEETLSEADNFKILLVVAQRNDGSVFTNWTAIPHCTEAFGLVEFLRLKLIEAIDR